jgi:hypothetical protein
MSKVKIELNREGVRELLCSAEMGEICMEQATAVAGRAGEGFAISGPYTGRNRVNVSVGAVTEEAYQDCLENNTLLKALGGGHG